MRGLKKVTRPRKVICPTGKDHVLMRQRGDDATDPHKQLGGTRRKDGIGV